MKKWGIFLAAVLSVVLVIVVALHPRYRQGLLMVQLERAPSAAEKVRLIQEVIDVDVDSARDYLKQYAEHDPHVAFDSRHTVGLVFDSTSGDVYIVGDRMAGSFRIGGTPVPKLHDIQLLQSDERVAHFVFQDRDELSITRYYGYYFKYDGETFKTRSFDYITSDNIARWQAEGIWPF